MEPRFLLTPKLLVVSICPFFTHAHSHVSTIPYVSYREKYKNPLYKEYYEDLSQNDVEFWTRMRIPAISVADGSKR
jgi:hypothetical protein